MRTEAPFISLIGLILVSATACNSGEAVSIEDPYLAELRAIRASYDGYFRANRPDYVMITYPESPGALSQHNQQVFELIKSCLLERGIPHACLTLDDALEELATERLNWKYKAYRIPPTIVEKVTDGVLMYINLEGPEKLRTKRHPVAIENNIDVRVWFDRSADEADV